MGLMGWIGWLRMKKIILKRPYLIDPYRSIGLKEARKRLRLSGYPSAEKILLTAISLASTQDVKEALERLLRKYSGHK